MQAKAFSCLSKGKVERETSQIIYTKIRGKARNEIQLFSKAYLKTRQINKRGCFFIFEPILIVDKFYNFFVATRPSSEGKAV